MKVTVVLLCVAIANAAFASSVGEFEVKDLPGLKHQLNFKHYSGYFNVTNTKRLHYWRVWRYFCDSVGSSNRKTSRRPIHCSFG